MAKKKKPTKKTTSKKVAKKVAKKAAKKPAKKTVKKATKKTAKKAVKKTAKATKKVTKTTLSKSAKPTAKVSAPTLTASTLSGSSLLGNTAPDITVINQSGEAVNLAAAVGSAAKVVLYFYPKDDTPGCTTEACNFRDNLNRLENSGVKVIGVSPDSPESHKTFREKYGLNFDLVSDTDHKLCETFNVWKEKNFMGKKYMGVERSTFLFDNGRVSKVWQPVKVEGHVDEILTLVGA